MTLQITGLDPSLTGSGVAEIYFPPRDAYGPSPNQVELITFKSTKTGDRWPDRSARIEQIALNVTAGIPSNSLVAMEGPSFGSKGKAVWDLTGMWWAIYRRLVDMGCEPLIITPSQRMMYATGSGQASKDEVLAAVVRRYPEILVRNNNEADALVFAMILYHLDQGHPWVDLPKTHTRALDKLRPEFELLRGVAV